MADQQPELKLTEEEGKAQMQATAQEISGTDRQLTVADLNAEQKAKLDQLVENLTEQKVAVVPSEGVALLWLKAKSFDVDQALEAYKAMLAWREENSVDTINDQPFDKEEDFLHAMPHKILGFDREGHPLYCEKVGAISPYHLANSVDIEDLKHNHTRDFERIIQQMAISSKELGREICTFTTILDLKGLGLSHAQSLMTLRAMTEFDLKYYPERLERVLMVNPPWVLPGIWELVKTWLDDSTRSRLVVINDLEKLKEYVDPKYLPVEYGGTAPELRVYTREEQDAFFRRDESGLQLEQEYIAAGGKLEKEVSLEAGQTVRWSFRVGQDYDVSFSADLTFEASSQQVPLKPAEKQIKSKGEYTATEKTKVKFLWDNSYSWIYGKYVDYHVSVVDAADDSEEKSA